MTLAESAQAPVTTKVIIDSFAIHCDGLMASIMGRHLPDFNYEMDCVGVG